MANDEIVELYSEEEIENAKANELSTRVDAKLRVLSSTAPAGTIFRVHELLRNVNVKAYEPQILSIGPYHRCKNHLTATEQHKLRYLKQLLERKGENNTNKYVSEMWKLKGEARACYVDSVDLEDDEFVEMMLLDACFIVDLLRNWTKRMSTEISDPMVDGGLTSPSVARDLLLVENQLPFFVLKKFFDMTKTSNEESLCHEIFQFYNEIHFFSKPGHVPKDESSFVQPVEHLLGLLYRSWTRHHSVMDSMDLKEENNCRFICAKLDSFIKASKVIIRKWFRLPSETESGDVTKENNWTFICSWFHSSSTMDNNWTSNIHNWIPKWFKFCSKIDSGNLTEEHDGMFSIRCATQLKEAGIKFKKAKSDKLFAVKFKNGIMEIPTLQIHDFTESLFRNLIAYEQFNWTPTMVYVSDYVRLMDYLVNTSKDVDLFCQCGIIDHLLGDNDVVANMFNRLCDNVRFDPEEYKYKEIFKEVNKHCNRRWNKWKANLRHNYFNTPWAIISFFAALLLLLLTATQTVFSVLAYIKQK